MGYAREAMNELHGTDAFTTDDSLGYALREVEVELQKARETHAPMNGHHEGYAVILEELDELWDVCKMNTHKFGSEVAVRQEQRAQKRAAMAIRFIEDVCDK